MNIPGFIPSVRSLPFSAVTERHKIFAFDLMFFLSKEYNVDWRPHGCPQYFVDPLSPWSPELGQALRILLRNREASFVERYHCLVPRGTAACQDVFGQYSIEILQDVLRKRGNPGDLFDRMAYVGRLAILFYQNGAREAINIAVVEIGESLRELMRCFGPGIFSELRGYANDIIKVAELAST